MDLNLIFSKRRTGKSTSTVGDPRSEYLRDVDRIIFSSHFRRLQNKTQVFPLPGSAFVHNRLTHSLEVASVGRSLGKLSGDFIISNYKGNLKEDSIEFYKYELVNVIAAACLCHDIGNPAFGHSGEDGISTYFTENQERFKDVALSQKQLNDFINFEGNPNSIRLLTQSQPGKEAGGLKLTYTTLMSIAKYPWESEDKKIDKKNKFGFFQSEKELFIEMATECNMIKSNENPLSYKRHPFVYLVEAADDICYNLVDLEDSHRLGISEFEICSNLYLELIKCLGIDEFSKVKAKFEQITDPNERIAYLRSKSINALVFTVLEVYKSNLDLILEGQYKSTLVDDVTSTCEALDEIMTYSRKFIYNNKSVVEIENAGYNIMYELLDHFIPPLIKNEKERTKKDKKAIALVPSQFVYADNIYNKLLGITDFISGMTDSYATSFYRKIKGIEIGSYSSIK